MAVRIGLLGLGRWGRIHRRTLEALDGVELVAASGRDLDAVLAERPDGVVIATPPDAHLAAAERALGHGCAVLVEKPLCTSVDQARRFLARSAGGLVRVGHVHLHHAGFAALRSALDGRAIRSVRSTGGALGPFRVDTRPLWDWGPHDVGLAMALVGALNLMEASLWTRDDAQGLHERVHVSARSDGGIPVELSFGNALAPKTRRLEVTVDEGRFVLDDLTEPKLAFEGRPIPVEPGLPLTRQAAAFVRAIETDDRDPTELEDAVAGIEFLAEVDRVAVRRPL